MVIRETQVQYVEHLDTVVRQNSLLLFFFDFLNRVTMIICFFGSTQLRGVGIWKGVYIINIQKAFQEMQEMH